MIYLVLFVLVNVLLFAIDIFVACYFGDRIYQAMKNIQKYFCKGERMHYDEIRN